MAALASRSTSFVHGAPGRDRGRSLWAWALIKYGRRFIYALLWRHFRDDAPLATPGPEPEPGPAPGRAFVFYDLMDRTRCRAHKKDARQVAKCLDISSNAR